MVRIAAIVAGGEPVLDQADPAFVDAHFSARDAGLGKADETRLPRSPRLQDEGASVHAFQPVPVLAEPGMAILGHLGLEAKSGAAVRPDFEKLARPGSLLRRLLPEQRERQLVARIEQGDGLLALAGAVDNATHFLGVARTLLGDRLAPDLGLGESAIAIEPGSGEPAQIGRDIGGDVLRESPPVSQAARMRVAVGGQERNAGHGLIRARLAPSNLHRSGMIGQCAPGRAGARC